MKFIKNLFDLCDPTRYAFLYSLQIMIPSILIVFIYLYLREPSGVICTIAPFLVFPAALFYNDYKNKALTIIFASIIIFIEMYIVGRTISIPILLILASSFIVFLLFRYKKLSSVIPISVMIPLLLAKHPTSYDSDNQVIAYFFTFLVMLLTVFVYELLFTKYELNQSIRYEVELVRDIFILCSSNDRSSIKHKELLSRNYLYRTNILVNKVFKNDNDMFFHKVSRAMSKIETSIDMKRFYYRRNKIYAYNLRKYYEDYRRIYRSISFMKSIKDLESLLLCFPRIQNYLDMISVSLSQSQRFLLNGDIYENSHIINDKYVNDAKSDIDLFINANGENMNNDVLYYLFGIKYTLNSVLILTKKMANKNFSI